jgi:hypothetical protein
MIGVRRWKLSMHLVLDLGARDQADSFYGREWYHAVRAVGARMSRRPFATLPVLGGRQHDYRIAA